MLDIGNVKCNYILIKLQTLLFKPTFIDKMIKSILNILSLFISSILFLNCVFFGGTIDVYILVESNIWYNKSDGNHKNILHYSTIFDPRY